MTYNMNEIKETRQLLTEVLDFIKATPWRADYQSKVERLYDLAERPCVLAVAGQVKAGKSSFLNALLGFDLAAVGTTETTATINVFKYGKVKDPERPVMVYWTDGREPEAQTRDFIDSLQGYTDDVLEKAENIDHIEYIIEDERLENITLVDTPGFASIVEEHEQRTSEFFNPRREKLRNRQFAQSGTLTESADAVIFISGPVAKANAQRFFGERIPHISPFNAIGVMAKIDMIQPVFMSQDDRLKGVSEVFSEAGSLAELLSKEFDKELYTVLPVSAGLYRAVEQLKCTGKIKELQEKIRRIPKEKFDKRFDMNSEHWEAEDGPYQRFFESCGLSLESRKEMLGDMPWMVFCMIVIVLYYLPLDEAEDYLERLSGMEQVKNMLEERFFKRSKSIRCARILRDARQILIFIKNMELPQKRTEVKSREAFLDIIKRSRGYYEDGLLDAFISFVEKNTSNSEELDRYLGLTDSLLMKIDNLLRIMEQTENINEGLVLLKKVRPLLRGEDEVRELEALLEGTMMEQSHIYFNQRQRVWRARMQRVMDNPELYRLLSIVCNSYSELLVENNN